VVDGDVHITGDLLRSTHAKECLEVASRAIEWGTPSEPPEGPAKLRGKGVSCTIKYTLTPPTRMSENGAEVELGEDGLFEVRIGTVNIGQGSDTTMAQIAADGLGVGLERIRIVHSDTALVPFDSSTTASRSTYHMGNAVLDAAAKLTADVLTVASQLLERDAASLALGPDGVEGADGGTLSYEELVQRSGGPLSALGECVVGGTYTAPDGTEYPIASTFWSFASAAAEVEVDTDTGEVRVLRMGAASNVGKAVNPDSVRTQLEGGVGMELGPTLFEQLVWDEGGQLLTAALMDYPLPTMETSPVYRPEIVEHPLEGGPFGAKGMGEIGSVITPAAVLNAVYDATGVMFHEVPLLPHKVLEALEGSS
ncbi:MAG: xanthine dehydrogenase family protein molybdopterin-binding subunit, partial [Chloroflexi bacterium]|nr:xanthine dehydrogenase family protein molybdopterin-binding subunit [Chloroflexota bacterium]